MNVKMRISVSVLAAAVVVCAALLLAWRPWGVDGDAGGGARAATQGKAEVASADAPQQVSEAPAKNVADAALTEEGFAALFPEGVEVINPGPSRDEFASDEEWEHYWEHFHEVEVGLSYGAVPVVKDAEGRQHIPGEIILYANEQMTDEAIVSVVESRGLHVANLNRMDGADVVATVYSDNIAADLDELCERFDDAENVTVEIDRSTGNWLDDDLAADAKSNRQVSIRGLSASRMMAGVASASDPLIDDQLYLTHAKFDKAWSRVKCDKSVSIAVLDTEIDPVHPDLADSLEASGRDGVHPGGSGHGTAVAGVACAEADNHLGIAGCSYNAKLVPVSAALADGTSNFTYLYNALEYVQNSLNCKPDVINISQSLPVSKLSVANIVKLDAAVATLTNKYGCVIVASAGNVRGSNELRYPAACPGVIGVGAVTPFDSHISGYVSNESVDLCALGDYIYTTTDPTSDMGQGAEYADRSVVDGDQVRFAGTSFAAPQVAAAAALVKAKHPSWTPALVERALEDSARKAPGMGGALRTDEYGFGILDADAALIWTQAKAPKITAACVSFAKSVNNILYTGKAIKPAVNVTVAGKLLVNGVDYTATHSNNVNAGTAKIVVTGKGAYSGSVTKTFKIKPSPLSGTNVGKVPDKYYTGKAQTQTLGLSFGGKKMKQGTDYTMTYSGNVNVGKAKVTVAGKGNFSGKVTRSFSIKPFYPAFNYKVKCRKADSIQLACILAGTPKSPVTRLRVYYGTSEKDLRTRKHFVTAKVNLKKKGAVGNITLKLKPNVNYCLSTTIGITSGGKDYFYAS